MSLFLYEMLTLDNLGFILVSTKIRKKTVWSTLPGCAHGDMLKQPWFLGSGSRRNSLFFGGDFALCTWWEDTLSKSLSISSLKPQVKFLFWRSQKKLFRSHIQTSSVCLIKQWGLWKWIPPFFMPTSDSDPHVHLNSDHRFTHAVQLGSNFPWNLFPLLIYMFPNSNFTQIYILPFSSKLPRIYWWYKAVYKTEVRCCKNTSSWNCTHDLSAKYRSVTIFT